MANRAQFLAVDPPCSDLQAWYQANPADIDVRTAQRYIAKCRDVPAIVTSDAALLQKLVPDIFAAGLPASSKARQLIRKAMVAATCDSYGGGERSPLEVANEVQSRGGDAQEVRAVLEASANTCPRYRSDLLLFTVPDIAAAAKRFDEFVSQAWPGAIGSDQEHEALAAMACKGALGDSTGKLLVSTVTGPGNEDRLISKAKQLLCP